MRINESTIRRIIREEARRALRESETRHPAGLHRFMDLRSDPHAVATKIIMTLGDKEFTRGLVIDVLDGDHSADMELMDHIQDALDMDRAKFEEFDPDNSFSDSVIDALKVKLGIGMGPAGEMSDDEHDAASMRRFERDFEDQGDEEGPYDAGDTDDDDVDEDDWF